MTSDDAPPTYHRGGRDARRLRRRHHLSARREAGTSEADFTTNVGRTRRRASPTSARPGWRTTDDACFVSMGAGAKTRDPHAGRRDRVEPLANPTRREHPGGSDMFRSRLKLLLAGHGGANIPDGRLTRREVLKAGAVDAASLAVLPAVLAACGSSSATPAPSAAAVFTPAPTPPATAVSMPPATPAPSATAVCTPLPTPEPLGVIEDTRVVFYRTELSVINDSGVLLNLVAKDGETGIRFFKDFGTDQDAKLTTPGASGSRGSRRATRASRSSVTGPSRRPSGMPTGSSRSVASTRIRPATRRPTPASRSEAHSTRFRPGSTERPARRRTSSR